jgi:hypothetical protein
MRQFSPVATFVFFVIIAVGGLFSLVVCSAVPVAGIGLGMAVNAEAKAKDVAQAATPPPLD